MSDPTDVPRPDTIVITGAAGWLGQNLVRAFQYARQRWAPWIGVMFVWNIADPNWTTANEQYWWSITNPDGTTRPAYDALANARTNGTLR